MNSDEFKMAYLNQKQNYETVISCKKTVINIKIHSISESNMVNSCLIKKEKVSLI